MSAKGGTKKDLSKVIIGLQSKVTEMSDQNRKLRAALEGWRQYFQRDTPMTAEAAEAQGEEFTKCWFETEKALSND